MTVLADGKGGRRQVTLGIQFDEASGDLGRVLDLYAENGGRYAQELGRYRNLVDTGDSKSTVLARDDAFKSLLRAAGNDPVMQKATLFSLLKHGTPPNGGSTKMDAHFRYLYSSSLTCSCKVDLYYGFCDKDLRKCHQPKVDVKKCSSQATLKPDTRGYPDQITEPSTTRLIAPGVT